ncbi:MAG: hypothetical protein V1765_00225 [bacterium]
MYNLGLVDLADLDSKKKIVDIIQVANNGSLAKGRIILVYNDSDTWRACVPYNQREIKELIGHLQNNQHIFVHGWYADDQPINSCVL